ncbi:MAG: hypothetical protein HY762_06185 [Planctomycetes bacterium]|nr:hypothetical protein [Planctomycetota bacterium]
MSKKSMVSKSAVHPPLPVLEKFFHRNGYVRVQNYNLKQKLGAKYHKGWEVRFVLKTPRELTQVYQLLCEAGFKPGNPFTKHGWLIQPVYGKQTVDYFLS